MGDPPHGRQESRRPPGQSRGRKWNGTGVVSRSGQPCLLNSITTSSRPPTNVGIDMSPGGGRPRFSHQVVRAGLQPVTLSGMSLLGRLRSAVSGVEPQADTDAVRRIMAELDKLEPAVARYLAAFAYVLGR